MNHKELDAWKEAMDLAESVYQLTHNFPKEEIYGLTSQIRRAVVSVPSNLSEGAARPSRKEFVMFLGYSLGSLAEMETQLILAQRLTFFDADAIFEKINRVRALLIGLRRSLQNHI